MIVRPKIRRFICTTAHPQGCASHVSEQINYVKAHNSIIGPKKVLVIGASTGFGLASRIVSTFGCGASTIGVFFEKPPEGSHTATAGWYNTAALEKAAQDAGLYAKSINGDAFSNEIKEQTIDMVKKDLGQVDLIVYSLASPRRIHPTTGETFSSVIKPIGKPCTRKTVDFHSGVVSDVTIEPATDEETQHTVQVMGGEDWEMWIKALNNAGVLAKGARTVAFSYIGPEITHPIYKDGTIGKAKNHLDATAKSLNNYLADLDGKAYISVNKALVTQASSAIPVVPLYISILFKVMKEKGTHEGCIEQMYRLFSDRLYTSNLELDPEGRIRIDDWEMQSDIQEKVLQVWGNIDSQNVNDSSDLNGYQKEFYKLFGFGLENVEYDKDVDIHVGIPSITE